MLKQNQQSTTQTKPPPVVIQPRPMKHLASRISSFVRVKVLINQRRSRVKSVKYRWRLSRGEQRGTGRAFRQIEQIEVIIRELSIFLFSLNVLHTCSVLFSRAGYSKIAVQKPVYDFSSLPLRRSCSIRCSMWVMYLRQHFPSLPRNRLCHGLPSPCSALAVQHSIKYGNEKVKTRRPTLADYARDEKCDAILLFNARKQLC